MEGFSLPRKLNTFREREYRDQLRKYAGTKFFVVTLAETEPLRFGRRIEDFLKSCGWEKEPMVRYAEADESMIPDGIWIESNGPVTSNPLLSAMVALKEVLTDSKIMAGRSFLNPRLPPAELPPNTLRVVIGLKPETYFEVKRWQKEAEEQRLRNLHPPPLKPPPPPKPE